jgi:cyclophilin family peptidyl-prolyl cis-trans isomerase
MLFHLMNSADGCVYLRMNKICILLLLVIFIVSCEPKQKIVEINQNNVRETLMQYGQNNPENEVLLETSYGNIRIKLYDDVPLHRANFIKLIKEGQYENAKFYRIFYQFMIQAGIYPKELNYTIPAEFNTKYIHKKGALSMARADENNPNLESSSSEFFIVHGSPYTDYQVENDEDNFNLKLTPEQKRTYMTQGGYMSLDQQYTVFGEVIEGLDVVDKIASVKTFEGDKPMKDIEVNISLITKNQ